jgi:hypothetical protein
MHHKAYVDMTAAMDQIRSGEKFVSVNRELAWVPKNIEESKVQTFVEAVKSAYNSGETSVEFDDATYQVEFVAERNDWSLKPGIYGRFDVALNEQVVRTFREVRQAKVFLVQKQHDSNHAPKKAFENSLVKSVKSL